VNPITPGRYRTRWGDIVEVRYVDVEGEYPVVGLLGGEYDMWTCDGKLWRHRPSYRDLVSRIEDEPQEANPLAAPLEWALAQLEPSLDPEWQAAYAAALEALKLAKGGSK
jgi:hypothetical protein